MEVNTILQFKFSFDDFFDFNIINYMYIVISYRSLRYLKYTLINSDESHQPFGLDLQLFQNWRQSWIRRTRVKK